jgi:hypothetical protein
MPVVCTPCCEGDHGSCLEKWGVDHAHRHQEGPLVCPYPDLPPERTIHGKRARLICMLFGMRVAAVQHCYRVYSSTMISKGIVQETTSTSKFYHEA